MGAFIVQFANMFPEINLALGTGIMVLIRLLGLFTMAPFFSRKEIPVMAKIATALLLTIICTMILKPSPIPNNSSLILCMGLNFVFGWVIGFIARCVLEVIAAGGDMINSQMGLSSAMVLDPSTRVQVPVMGNLFNFLGLIVFIFAGGVYWLLDAFLRSFEIFGMYATTLPLERIVNIDYLVFITSNILYMGMQIAAPILLATLGQDIVLGIISKTAPQVNVFQLSFLFKPVMGSLIMIWILPMLVNVIHDHLITYAKLF